MLRGLNPSTSRLGRVRHVVSKYIKFIGPGLMVSVAYMDPGNYSTAVAAGAGYQYKLLFSIFVSNCLAVFLQILLAKLGAVTGLDLAANCRENLSPRLNLFIYVLAEIAIIATDLAEVVGTAIALNILFGLPLFAGILVTVTDVIVVLMAYKPDGPLLFIRIFELFVSILVAATVVCFLIELYQVLGEATFLLREVLKGFLPNEKVVDMSDRAGGSGLFLSLAILGATVMPHSLYLGLGLVQARLKDYDVKHGFYKPPVPFTGDTDAAECDQSGSTLDEAAGQTVSEPTTVTTPYRPSIHAIKDTMTYTIVELIVSLFTVALFVNAAILIVAGATLGHGKRDDDDLDTESDDEGLTGDLFTIYNLLVSHLLPTAGFVFALALLCSGQSAGVVCTLAGQMVLEGFLLWSFPPAVRRLATRGLAIAPCLAVVSIAGREGLAQTLNVLQVVLSLLLPVVIAPLIWFTSSKSIMRVATYDQDVYDVYDDTYGDTYDETFDATLTLLDNNNRARRKVPYNVSDAAIRLQTLRSAHPCAGWEDSDDEAQESAALVPPAVRSRTHSFSAPSLPELSCDRESEDGRIIQGYIDMSNGPIMTATAVLVWGFLSALNIFLLASMLLGYNVPL